jgi:hypothetical protein
MGCDMQFSRQKPMFRANLLHLDFYTLKKEISLSTEIMVPLQHYTLSHLRTPCLTPLKSSLRDPGSTIPYGINIAIKWVGFMLLLL